MSHESICHASSTHQSMQVSTHPHKDNGSKPSNHTVPYHLFSLHRIAFYLCPIFHIATAHINLTVRRTSLSLFTMYHLISLHSLTVPCHRLHCIWPLPCRTIFGRGRYRRSCPAAVRAAQRLWKQQAPS